MHWHGDSDPWLQEPFWNSNRSLGDWTGIVVGIFGLIIGILAGALGIMIAAYIFGAVSIVYGAVMLFVNPFRGLMSLGLGCIGLAVGFYDISVHMALSENASGSDPDGRKSTS